MATVASAHALAKRRAALLSVAASAGLTVLKLAAGLLSGSLALLSEGAHNALDMLVSGLTYAAVRAADKPADEDHPFGHAKIEAVAALAQTAFLIALALGVAALAIGRLGAPAAVRADAFAFLAVAISIAVDILRWRALRRVAHRTGSEAIAADALHYASDLVSSGLVLVGLALTRAGLPAADALAAVGVAGFILVSGWRLGSRTVDSLIDAAPRGLAHDVRQALRHVEGVEAVDFLRLRRLGPKTVGELGVLVSRTLPLEGVAAIAEGARARLAERWPALDLTISAHPLALDGETAQQRVLLIAARRGLMVHHLQIQRMGNRTAVSLDLEIDGRQTLARAHDDATRLEQAIAAEFGADVEVETHIEPIETRELPGEDAAPELTAAVEVCLSAKAKASGLLRDIHDVRLRAAGGGLFGVFHCRADRGASVEAVHLEVDAVERAARAAFPQISRIIGHAEPS